MRLSRRICEKLERPTKKIHSHWHIIECKGTNSKPSCLVSLCNLLYRRLIITVVFIASSRRNRRTSRISSAIGITVLCCGEDRYHGSKKAGELAQKEKSFLESLGKIGSLGKRKDSKFLESNFVKMVAAHRNMTDDSLVNKVEETLSILPQVGEGVLFLGLVKEAGWLGELGKASRWAAFSLERKLKGHQESSRFRRAEIGKEGRRGMAVEGDHGEAGRGVGGVRISAWVAGWLVEASGGGAGGWWGGILAARLSILPQVGEGVLFLGLVKEAGWLGELGKASRWAAFSLERKLKATKRALGSGHPNSDFSKLTVELNVSELRTQRHQIRLNPSPNELKSKTRSIFGRFKS
ncbi:hypothetical protein M5K25_015169 [Dendrobium thyrsiflorum]|uniref:Uncharacterized protein n=1 Tax=Dendrobium thyrsiflorum TaxID=117978 RepID=A0ABD0UQA6_DENTH